MEGTLQTSQHSIQGSRQSPQFVARLNGYTGSEISVLHPGEAATFRAGDPSGHCLENRSSQDVRYLVIGTRASSDTVTYPDNDRILKFDREAQDQSWTDLAGNPSVSPYEKP